MGYLKRYLLSPSRTILLSMAFTIVLGTVLLSLPFAQKVSTPFIDTFFTSTSSVCVTGLMTVPMENFTLYGHAIILFLMQIGGLGLITLTLFVISLFINLGLATQVMAGEMLDLESWKGAGKILLFIIVLTLLAETIGAFFFFQTLKNHYPLFEAIFYSFFQSVSAFCNAGMTPFETNMATYVDNYNILITSSILMILGGIGFITLNELIFNYVPMGTHKKVTLSLQTQIILSYFFWLTVGTAIVFWLLERNNTLAKMDTPLQLLNSLFTSISSRSAGFLTVHANDLQQATLLTIMINAFIGCAPGSTGSGIKLTTAALFVASINAAIIGKTSINIAGRRIMKDQIYKALAVVSLSMAWITLTTFCLLITERSWQFIDILFETVSAFTTLGASIGITPYLSTLGKLLIILTMFIGRIGSLTLMIALRKRHEKNEFTFPEERVMIT